MSIETMTKLATVTVGSGGSASIDFTNIPQTYTDLKILCSTRATRSGQPVDLAAIKFNDSSSGYSDRDLYGDYSAAYSSNSSNVTELLPQGFSPASTATSNTFSNNEIYITNYAGNNYKSVSMDIVLENNSSTANDGYTTLNAGLWSNTSPITKITISNYFGTGFSQYSTFTLYGIRNARKTAGNSIKATGGNISFDGTYVVHTFTTSGTFTPTVNIPRADYLVVAGGGGGGANQGGGGGAGGLRSTVTATGGGGSLESALSLAANTGYTVTVGGGGAGQSADATGGNGSNSVFSTITSTGGGGGGWENVSGLTGGSGGGGGRSASGAAGTANQGYAGGNSSTNRGSSGGGGAGAVGTNSSGDNGANGGNGVATSISGSSVTYAGGGGGGAYSTSNTAGNGGTGGGGNGRGTSVGSAGSTNTGGGGGGGTGTNLAQASYNGGSGVVIIRYKA